MNPYDPRNPGGAPPGQQPWGPQPGPAPQQGAPVQGAYGQGQPPQSPQFGQAPPQGQPSPGQYPPNQPAQYPPNQPGQYPQNPQYGQTPPGPGQQPYPGAPPAPKKGMGAGAIAGILVALLVVLGGLGLGAFFLLGGGLSDDTDQSLELKKKVGSLLAAAQAKDPKQIEDSILDLTMLPAKAEIWFKESFGPKDGKELYDTWERDVFKELPTLVTPFKEAIGKGETEIRVTRFASGADVAKCGTPFCLARKAAHTKIMKARKGPHAIYFVRFAKPGASEGSSEDELYYFAIVNGQFAFLGPLYPLSFG